MSYSVIIVGGGIIGTSSAYYLSKLGVDVTLIEAKDLASGTAGASGQHVLLQTKKPGPVLGLAIESSKIYKNLEEELDADLEYRNEGGIIITKSEEESSFISQRVSQQRKEGLNVEMLSVEEVRKKQPGLDKNIMGSTWCPEDAKVNSFNVCFSMMKAARRLGAKVRLNAKVNRLITNNSRVTGVEVQGEKLYADAVLIAAGIWTPQLLTTLDIDVPIIPRRGQILVTEKIPSFLKVNLISSDYIMAKSTSTSSESTNSNSAGVGLVMEQTVSGNLLIGGSREFVGFDRETTPEVIASIGKAAVETFPMLSNVRIVRTFAGLRPNTPDGKPILGPVEGYSNLYVSAGHEGDGIALAPISGKIMANIICDLDSELDISPFLLKRFK